MAQWQRHRLRLQPLVKPTVTGGLIPPSWARKLPGTLWTELDTLYEKQGGEFGRATSETQRSWAVPSAHGS